MASVFKRTGVLRRFSEDRSGNFAVLTGAVILMLGLAAGYSTNVAQIYNVRSNLVASLDAALISAGRDISTGAIKEAEAGKAIKLYLEANGDPAVNNGGHQLVLVEPVTINKTAKTITATAYVDVDAFLPLFAENNRTRVSTTAATAYSNVLVEIGLMLDVTGSMGWAGSPLDGKSQTKLQNLQTAAKQAVQNLLARNQPGLEPRVRVAIIPYSQGVNAGKLAGGSYVEFDPAKDGKGGTLSTLLLSVLGTINGLLGDLGFTKVPEVMPTLADLPSGPQRPVGLAELSDMSDPKNIQRKQLLTEVRKITDDGCTTERKIKKAGSNEIVFDPSEDSPNAAMINRDRRLGKDDGGKSGCPASPVVPLTADGKALDKAIDGLKAGGGTAGHIGVQWTQYMLSPSWADFLGSEVEGSEPAAYSGNVRKVAVLMTDGEFNAAYVGVPEGEDTARRQESRSADYAKTLCKGMKANNVEIFTIGFMLNAGTETLKECASDDYGKVKHFYNASNAEELNEAFDAVTANFEVLRLTQ